MINEFDTPENPELSKIIHIIQDNPELKALDYSDLPTSPEIIAAGIRDMIEFKRSFSSLEQNDFLDSVFLGISPEVGCVVGTPLNNLSPELQQQVISFLERKGYVVLDLSSRSESISQRLRSIVNFKIKDTTARHLYSIINVQAAKKVISHDLTCSDSVFSSLTPEERESVGLWLKSHPNEWVIGDKRITSPLAGRRLGLLSGYPRNSVMKFERFHEINRNLFYQLTLLGFNIELVKKIMEIDPSYERENARETVLNDSRLAGQARSDFEFYISAFGTEEFLAFSPQDAEWRKQLLNIVTIVNFTLSLDDRNAQKNNS